MTATLIPTTHDALLRAVLLAPHDDQPRLIYADWCEENGQEERAEFIREMIDCHRNWLADPYFYKFEWVKGIRAPLESACKKHGFSASLIDHGTVYLNRGFVREIHCTHDYFLEHAAAIFAAHPVERVVLEDKRPWEASLTTWGWAWLDAQGQQSSHPDYVASEIFRHIRLLAPLPRRGDIVCGFDTEQDALAALSRGCVALGRERASLPPLTK